MSRKTRGIEDPTTGAGDGEGMPAVIQWIHKRRPLLTFVFVVIVVILALIDSSPPARLLDPRVSVLFLLPWGLAIVGVWIRIWGAGNLRKNEEITATGVYRMVRHPLYLGSLCIFLAFFLTIGNPWTGAALWLAMVVTVYYPTMMDEESWLTSHYPGQTAEYQRLPRLIPNLWRLGAALRTDRFTLRAAYRNLGLRSLWFLVALPGFLELLRWIGR